MSPHFILNIYVAECETEQVNNDLATPRNQLTTPIGLRTLRLRMAGLDYKQKEKIVHAMSRKLLYISIISDKTNTQSLCEVLRMVMVTNVKCWESSFFNLFTFCFWPFHYQYYELLCHSLTSYVTVCKKCPVTTYSTGGIMITYSCFSKNFPCIISQTWASHLSVFTPWLCFFMRLKHLPVISKCTLLSLYSLVNVLGLAANTNNIHKIILTTLWTHWINQIWKS